MSPYRQAEVWVPPPRRKRWRRRLVVWWGRLTLGRVRWGTCLKCKKRIYGRRTPADKTLDAALERFGFPFPGNGCRCRYEEILMEMGAALKSLEHLEQRTKEMFKHELVSARELEDVVRRLPGQDRSIFWKRKTGNALEVGGEDDGEE